MHDPDTQAFVIPYGWRTERFKNGTKWRYWKPFITIWHHDPERHGNDDSCGWSRPNLNATTKEIVKNLAGDEAREPFFLALDAKSNDDPILCERMIFGAFMLLSLCMKNRGVLHRAVSVKEATRWAAELTYNAVDNFRSTLCFKSGYHSNWYKDGIPNTAEQDKFWREEQAKSFFGAIARYILRERRVWFQHPKWHVIHWKRRLNYAKPINGGDLVPGAPMFEYKYWGLPLPVAGWHLQIHPLQTFKRWAFSRCCKCGKGFAWGYSPTTYSWNGTGPRWFRSEPDVFHGDCDRPRSECVAMASDIQGA